MAEEERNDTRQNGDAYEAPLMLSLNEIASWNPGICAAVTPPIIASVPALQRGLVWRPQQIELLWDSILRGFPIGAMVVCPKMEKQERKPDERITHHLLDGQQRCNAIALGFTDPFSSSTAGETTRIGSILWLDLDPEFEQNSTRSYLVRVTTMAHPWGYKRNDETDPLSTWAIRDSLNRINLDPAAENYKRPSPVHLWPYDATTSVPVAWLLGAWAKSGDGFWNELAAMAKSAPFPWADNVCRFCDDPSPKAVEQKSRIIRGIKRAAESRFIVLNAPPELLEVSQQERTAAADTQDVTNIEQLFQRLNQQGTRLDGEELSYSMIKAYWGARRAGAQKEG
jgi:hypothetical protein